ncbi:MAG: hypothetical protein M3156_06075 [Thermoproteota archaeon]|nr:hypothetical protein [Thermoproteota archaeon]
MVLKPKTGIKDSEHFSGLEKQPGHLLEVRKSLVGLARSPYSLFRNIVPLTYPTRFSVH